MLCCGRRKPIARSDVAGWPGARLSPILLNRESRPSITNARYHTNKSPTYDPSHQVKPQNSGSIPVGRSLHLPDTAISNQSCSTSFIKSCKDCFRSFLNATSLPKFVLPLSYTCLCSGDSSTGQFQITTTDNSVLRVCHVALFRNSLTKEEVTAIFTSVLSPGYCEKHH